MTSARTRTAPGSRGSQSRKESQPHQGAGDGARVKPFRVTVDLDPADYDVLRDFAHDARLTHADVLRSLVRLLDEPTVGQRIRGVSR